MYIYVRGIKLQQQQKRHRSQLIGALTSQIRDNLNMKRNKNGNGSQLTEKKEESFEFMLRFQKTKAVSLMRNGDI